MTDLTADYMKEAHEQFDDKRFIELYYVTFPQMGPQLLFGAIHQSYGLRQSLSLCAGYLPEL